MRAERPKRSNVAVAALASVSLLTACGSSTSPKSSGWTSADQASYLVSCHKLALRGLKGVTTQQRDTYCAGQLKNAEEYNPHHIGVHGFVGAYSVSGGPG